MKSEEEWNMKFNAIRSNAENSRMIIQEIRQEYDKVLRSAIEDYLNEHSDPKTEYGPHGVSIDWYHEEDVSEAIEKAKVEEV